MTIDDIIARLMAMFGEPKTIDPDLFLAEYAKAIKGWDVDVMSKAADEAIKECVYWPKPAELIKRAERIAADMYRPSEPKDRYAWKPEPSDEEKARVQGLVDAAKRAITATGLPADKISDVDWKAGQKAEFEKMQRESPNSKLHQVGGLTAISRRMAGDTQ